MLQKRRKQMAFSKKRLISKSMTNINHHDMKEKSLFNLNQGI
jgi:hypothetical protein